MTKIRIKREELSRLFRILDFSVSEIDYLQRFLKIDYRIYLKDADKRHALERCIENIVNSSLDIAKILLISENIPIPGSYKEYFMELSARGYLTEATMNILANGVKLRNILAHEYLDIRWSQIEGFLKGGWKNYKLFIKTVREKIKGYSV